MSFENIVTASFVPTAPAIAQFTFVKVTTGGAVTTAGNTEDAIGIAMEASALNATAAIPVALLNGSRCEVTCGAGVTAGANVMSNADGKAITATGATAKILGVALETSTALNQRITILTQKAAGVVGGA